MRKIQFAAKDILERTVDIDLYESEHFRTTPLGVRASAEGGDIIGDPKIIAQNVALAFNLARLDFIDRHREEYELPDRWAVLSAHGLADNGWAYCEREGVNVPVQNWIDEHDGNYGLLFLSVCNPLGQDVTSKRSLLGVHDRNVSRTLYEGPVRDDSILDLIHPRLGTIEYWHLED